MDCWPLTFTKYTESKFTRDSTTSQQFVFESGYLTSILRGGGFMNWNIYPSHIHPSLNNLLDMGFIETMGRPRKKSERKNSTKHPQSVASKLKTTLSEACFETSKYLGWPRSKPKMALRINYHDFHVCFMSSVYWHFAENHDCFN